MGSIDSIFDQFGDVFQKFVGLFSDGFGDIVSGSLDIFK